MITEAKQKKSKYHHVICTKNKGKKHLKLNSKQLLDEVKHDSENSISRPRFVFAKSLDNSRYDTKTESDNYL